MLRDAPEGRASDLADAAEEVLVDLELAVVGGVRCVIRPGRTDRHGHRHGVAHLGGEGRLRRDLDERTWRYGKKKTDFRSSTKTGRLPSSVRRFVQRTADVAGVGSSNRSASERLLVVEVQDGVADHGRIVRRGRRARDWPDGPAYGW